jgi:hypothetical protein
LDNILQAPITEQEVLATQKTITPQRAPGPDSIRPEFLINLGKDSIPWVLHLFNKTWTEGKLLNSWKKAKAILRIW